MGYCWTERSTLSVEVT